MSAFASTFRATMDAIGRDALVDLYVWANAGSAPSVELRERGEAWAREVEAAGRTADVLAAAARVT